MTPGADPGRNLVKNGGGGGGGGSTACVGVYLRGPGSIQYGGRPRDSMCILVATVKIIPTTSRVCHLLQLGVRSEEPSWENDASKMCVYMPLKE